MPRGQKSKLRARKKCRQARDDTHSVQGAQATAAEEEGFSSSSSPPFGGSPPSSPAAGIPQGPQSVPPTTTAASGALDTRAAGGAQGQDEGRPSSSKAPAPTERSQRDPVTRRASMLLRFWLYKYKMKEPITKAEMMKIINKSNGNRATEEEVWEFLSVLGIYNGKRHFMFGDPRKLITKDLVQEEYLEYWQVPNSDPPCYEFL
ncbi:melanoma-associated antigen B4-like [Loxodonta africana]|uniref:melanoma-associated antigen B4-like n=1 Tax=Loxodonta africana TaxID=9785 RepID=UPI00054064AD|nr:melanoma-associated antigen B4-like [Loxodonta africana]